MAKTVGGVAAGGSIFGIAQSILGAASGGNKFSREDVKKVYFVRKCLESLYCGVLTPRMLGELVAGLLPGDFEVGGCTKWHPILILCHFQAMDIAGLSKLTSDTLVLIVSILGFLVSHIHVFRLP